MNKLISTRQLLPCPFCGSPAEIVHASHIRCANIYNCDCETRLGEKAWNRRAQGMSDTPRTDSLCEKISRDGVRISGRLIDFAEQLERELAGGMNEAG